MLGTAFDAAETVHAVGVAEDAVLRRARREESEGALLRAQSALHAAVGDADAAFSGSDHLVDFAHRTDRTPEIAVEDQPADEPDRGRDDDHDVKEHPDLAEGCRPQPGGQPGNHRQHHDDRRLAVQETGGNFALRIRQQGIERPAGTEVAASVPSAVPDRVEQPHCHIEEHAVGKPGIPPPQRQNDHESRRSAIPFHRFEIPFHDARSSTIEGQLIFLLRNIFL